MTIIAGMHASGHRAPMANRKRLPPPKPKEEHPFLEMRFLAVCTLVALGAGVGIALMLAKILVLLGLILALASAVGGFSIYARHYYNVYTTIKNKRKYQGPGAIELLVSFAVIVVVTVISPIVYFANADEELQLNKAELRLVGIEPFKPAGSDLVLINVRWKNAGTLAATNTRIALIGVLWNGQNPIGDTKPSLASVEKTLEETRNSNTSDIFSQDIMILTVPNLSLLDQEWNAVQQGSASLYVFYSLEYQDDAIRKKGHWHSNFCAWFTYRQNFYHNCGPNHLERITSP